MASLSSKLSPKDKVALATFYETETYGSLKRLLKLAQANCAQGALNALDFNQVKWLQGQHVGLELLEKEMDTIHKWSQQR
jgi:hypothetical protein